MVREWRGEPGRSSAIAGRAALLGAVVAATLLAGCSTTQTAADDVIPVAADSPREPSATPEDATTTTLDEDQIKADVEAAYRSAMAAFDEAAAEPVDPNYPGIDEWYEGPARERLVGIVEAWASSGQALRYADQPAFQISIVGADIGAASAELTVCLRDDGIVYDVASGFVVNDNVSVQNERVELRRTEGSWKVWERTVVPGGEAACAFDT